MKHIIFLVGSILSGTIPAYAQNVGVGTTTPTLGKFVVRGTVGAVSAMFGDNTAGVSLMNSAPSIGFNYYYNGSEKSINTGFGGSVGIFESTGQFFIATSAASVTGQGTSMPLIRRILIQPNGYVGIGITPASMFDVNGRIRVRKTSETAGIGFDGIDNANNPIVNRGFIGMLDNDYVGVFGSVIGWGMSMNVNNGFVGIGNTMPGSKLEVRNNTANTVVNTVVQEGAGGGIQVQSKGAFYASLYALNLNGGPAIGTQGKVGVNTQTPNSILQVAGGVSLPYKDVYDNYTATENDYSIQMILTGNTDVDKTIYLPRASGCKGRIYKISAKIPFSGPATCFSFNPTIVRVIEAETNIDIIVNEIQKGYGTNTMYGYAIGLRHFSCLSGGSSNDRTDVKLTSITVQSNGSVWKEIDNNYSAIFYKQ
ncbi:hypothetical protein [Polluticaenibacter yanchengensis]|uniref:Uncharacterized protein n=1 Tax=Polluticaenibacter yanchengensis TaxID=3014562 RepID=A0ABT4UGT3_9BACT|nr:hypothetical protein [Chitinophagaceae bacterium LY-5]